MSERSDLEKQASELAASLGEEIKTSRLSNEKLAGLVTELRAKKAEHDKAARETEIEKQAAAKALEARNANANEYRGDGLKFEYQVAPGKELTCRAGVLKSGAEVRPGDVRGQKALDDLVKLGSVLRRAPVLPPAD